MRLEDLKKSQSSLRVRSFVLEFSRVCLALKLSYYTKRYVSQLKK